MLARTLPLTLAALLVATTAQAQGTPMSPTFGIMAGVNLADVGGDDVEDTGMRTGLLAGIFMDVPFGQNPNWSFRPELLFSMQGAEVDDIDATVATDYIALPLLVRFTGGTAGGTRPFFAIGPVPAVQVKCELSGEGVEVDCDELADQGGKIEFPEKKTFDLAAKIEAGLDFAAGERTFTIGAGFLWGFINAFKDLEAKHRVISIFGGIGF